MIFPQVFISTLFIFCFCTFAKGTIENMEERFEVLEVQLKDLVSFTAYFGI